jgi:Mn-dependent DtxR family transcriptional regulator
VLLLITELSIAGPSIVAKELNISLSTAHRDMAYLEKIDLLRCDENGKRSLTEEGLVQVDLILK